MKNLLSAIVLATLAIMQSCSSGSGEKVVDANTLNLKPEQVQQLQQSNVIEQNDIKFTRQSLRDEQYLKGDAVSMLVPEGWNMTGQVYWNVANIAVPVVVNLIAENQNEHKRFEAFPCLSFISMPQSPYARPGTYMYGAYVVQQVPDAMATIQQYIIPYFRKNVQNMKIVDQQDLRSQVPNAAPDADIKMVRIEYTENGKTVEEKILATKSGQSSNSFSTGFIVAYSYKAVKGELDNYWGNYLTMFNSLKTTDNFNQAIAQVSGQSYQQGMASINQAGKTSQQISQNNDQMINGMDQQRNYANNSYNNGGGSYSSGGGGSYYDPNYSSISDKTNENFSDYIRDQQSYYDQSGNEYKLQSGADNAWIDQSGTQYIQSQTPGYDPNVGSTQSYTPLTTEAPAPTTPDE